MDQALSFLLDTAFGLLTYAFLLRFMMQGLRAPFRNPAGQHECADMAVGNDEPHVRSVEGASRKGVSVICGVHGFGGAAGISARNQCGRSIPRAMLSRRRPIDHRRRRFRGRECHAPCTTHHARGPA